MSVHTERRGIDVHQHAMLRSPEYVIHGYRQPHFAPTGPPMAHPLAESRPEPGTMNGRRSA